VRDGKDRKERIKRMKFIIYLITVLAVSARRRRRGVARPIVKPATPVCANNQVYDASEGYCVCPPGTRQRNDYCI
jgi:hypothetical protein